jgi:polar amino acid transport system substrate-binding protein
MTSTHVTAELVQALAPTGTLRAAINLGNAVLAARDQTTGQVSGVSVDLANLLALRLGVPVSYVVVDNAGKSVDALHQNIADIGFFAIDPLRGQEIQFTGAYVLIEGSYLVRGRSELQSNEAVDQRGHTIVVAAKSAYDLHLSREIKFAELVRAPNSQSVVDQFLRDENTVAAGVRQQLEADANRLPNLRILPGRFMVIQQAMGCSKSRGLQASNYLAAFVEDMKASGEVARALTRHQIEGAGVAPPVE